MADAPIERRLRRAFSYREKARQLERECARSYDAGEIESDRYASLREFYANHIRQAEAALDALRVEIRMRRDEFLEQYRAVDAAQAALSEQLNAGHISPERANRENRRLMASADACRKAMANCDRLLNTASPDDVGGFIDWPLATFSQPAAALEGSEDADFDWERAFVYALPFLIAATVFLPWLTLEGTSKSLPGLGDFGRALGLPAMLGPLPANLLWVAFLLLPLGALPFAAMSRNRPSGIALILCGFALVWLVLTAVIGLPLVTVAEGITLGAVIRGLHVGPFLYFGGAIGLVILGQRRLRMRELNTESGSRAVLIMSACMIFLMVVAASAVWLQVQQGFVAYGARLVDDRTGAVNVLLANEGRVQAAVFAPWPGGVPGREPAVAMGDVYGLSVHIRERGNDDFRLLTESRGAWLYAGLPIRDDFPLLVEPRSRIVLTLAPWQLRAIGVDPAAVRILFSRRNGEILGQSEHEMPELRAEPSTPAFVITPRTLATTSPPTTDRGAIDAESGTQPASTPLPSGTAVAFTGLMGDRAVLQIAPAGEAASRVMRARDEEVARYWVVLEVVAAPPGVTLFNERSYETVHLRMGESALLPE